MNKIKSFVSNSPEELERQFEKWSEDKEVLKIHYQINSFPLTYESDDGSCTTLKTIYSILVEYDNQQNCDCEQ